MITKLRVMRPHCDRRGPEELLEVDLPAQPGYKELRRVITPLLDGGDLEHVLVYAGTLPYLGERYYRDMFVDEEGHALLFRTAEDGGAVRDRPGKNLPRNDAATELYLRNWRLHEAGKPVDPDYFIVGPAVLFPDRRVWF